MQKITKTSAPSEVILAGLRLLKEHETHMETLQDALVKGEQIGRSLLSIDQIFAKALKRYELNNGLSE